MAAAMATSNKQINGRLIQISIYLTLKGNHYSSDPIELDSFFGHFCLSRHFYRKKFGYQNGIHYICKKDVIMTVVSIRDFRANQSKYLGLAAGGESVILTSRTGSFKIVPITEDDSLISKKEFFARIDEARKSIAEGKGTSVSGKEELDSLLASL
ncbi:MAG: type II toxin-antitoxin system Phd/YefM family antitoxin [Bacteroidales bacterium]|nr:type II toxin-antitoxin system Phd/YefM family antitoxin [Bacteroidales bacterium]